MKYKAVIGKYVAKGNAIGRFNIEPAKTWELQNEANSFKDKVGEAIVELLNGGFFKLKTKPSAPQNSVENSSIR
ncbi:MAG: hypothetical protein FWB90_10070 [Fibromonadales bacterium]|nr:hypothetical protein [Fibromonadales bacterium]